MKNTFLIISICWLVILNSLILTYIPGSSDLSTRNLITGATTVETPFTSSLKHIAIPLIILNITTIIVLVYVFSRIKDRRKIKFEV